MMNLHTIRDSNLAGSDFHVRWSSVFCGATVTLSVALLLLLFGNAVNLSVRNAVDPAIAGGFWSWLYSAVALVFSFSLGGLIASRTSTSSRLADVFIQGMVTWSVASLLGTIFVFFLGMNNPLLRGIATNSANWLALCVIGLG
jgi:hypothetical protein